MADRFPVDAPKAHVIKAFEALGFRVVREREHVSMERTGTHQGTLLATDPTGKRVSYSGVAIFHIRNGVIQDAWVLGDTQSLAHQLGITPR